MSHLPFILSAGILPSAIPRLMDPTCSPVSSESCFGVMSCGSSLMLIAFPSSAFGSVGAVAGHRALGDWSPAAAVAVR